MGTGGEWIEVILPAVFWGDGMLLFDSLTGKNAETRSHSHWANDLGTALGGLLFGFYRHADYAVRSISRCCS